LRRGFKALAERNALAARVALGLTVTAPIDPWQFADHLQVVVLKFADLQMTPASLHQLTRTDPESWSAMTLREGDTFAIVVNPAHALTRQRTDLMHELAHIQLKHVPSRVEVAPSGLLLLSDYSDEQEQEADWHAAAFLLPRDGLVEMRARNESATQIATYYGVSEALCAWRLRMTGVEVQMRRVRARQL
jgi:Zn-dependent peptidase ImmA (M78 family)